MNAADLKAEQVVERDWPVWACALRPRVRSARVELFQEFVAWMREQAAPMWEGQSGHVLSTLDHHTQRETLAKALVRDARDEVLCADWWDRLISAGNSLKGWNIPLLPPVVRMPLLQPMVVRRDFLLLHAFRQFELRFWEKLSWRNEWTTAARYVDVQRRTVWWSQLHRNTCCDWPGRCHGGART
jgi:hypothetical protein